MNNPNEWRDTLTKEQRSIYKKQYKKAVEYFNLQPGYVLHHTDTSLRHTDIDRYIQWNPEDLIVLSKSEHTLLHISLGDMGFKSGEDNISKQDDIRKKNSEWHTGKTYGEETNYKKGSYFRGKCILINLEGKRVAVPKEEKDYYLSIGYTKITAWNKGLTKETDERVANYAKLLSSNK